MTEKTNQSGYIPTEKDISSGAVQRAVFAETIQHPATILPIGASAGLLILLAGGLVTATSLTLALPLITGATGVCTWIFNFFVRGDQLAAKYAQNFRQKFQEARHQRIQSLAQECLVEGFDEGAKETRELEGAYLKLERYLLSQSQSDKDNSVRYGILARDILEEGQNILRSALEAHKALRSINVEDLRNEKNSWERQLKRKRISESEIKALQTRIASHERRIKTFDEHTEKLAQLMAKIEDLEGALENSYLELVELAQGRSSITFNESASRLERAVAAARKVDQLLSGKETAAEDEQYLKAAREKQ